MNAENVREELLVTRLDEAFLPKENLSPYALKDKWRVIPYDTHEQSGNMLSCIGTEPGEITFDPKLEGWYKIYLQFAGRSALDVKLSSDNNFHMVIGNHQDISRCNDWYTYLVEEALWRCADMTGEAITVAIACDFGTRRGALAGIRFVPMSDEEVAAYRAEWEDKKNKRLYVSDDMHNRLCCGAQTFEDFLPVVSRYEESDVEWISLEDYSIYVSGNLPTENIDDFSFFREVDKNVQRSYSNFDTSKLYPYLVGEAHKRGFKVSFAYRMTAWGLMYPYDQYYFDNSFIIAHPEFRTVDRNGEGVYALSYAYDEVQEYFIDKMLSGAESGCEAITLIANRAVPFVLFEEPVAKRFYEKYGEYPYELPLDEPRLNALHCEIMLEFMRKLRRELDERFGKNKVEIHMRANFSPFDMKVIGLDIEQMLREGLITKILSYPNRHYENLAAYDVWKDSEEYRIDLDKYTKAVHENIFYCHPDGGDFIPPYKNYRGELCGPQTSKERVEEWVSLGKKYGAEVYIDIMPRIIQNSDFKRRVLEYYEWGVDGVALWDACERQWTAVSWDFVRRLGHKDELADIDPNKNHRYLKIYRIAGMEINRYSPGFGG